MEDLKEIYFEELETMEELDKVSEFAGAAIPWIACGLGIIFT